MGESDQQWIYNNYTCEASNALGSANFSIELRRARMFAVTEITEHFFIKADFD